MKLHIVVSTTHSGSIALGLAKAATRAAIEWSIFFTSDGVQVLSNEELIAILPSASSAIACEESWNLHAGNLDCAVEMGSQTNNSALVGDATKHISL